LGLGKALTGLGLKKFKKPWAWVCTNNFSTPAVVSALYHNPPVVRCLYTTIGLWFVVYSVVYTLYYNPPVVRCLFTSGMWFVVYSVVSTLYHNPPVVRCLYTTRGLWFSIYSIIHTIFNHYNEENKNTEKIKYDDN
jgi:hypothetical protein